MDEKCIYCGLGEDDIDHTGDEVELRPYGPNGAWLCFECMMAGEDRQKEAEKQFGAQCDAAGDFVVIGHKTGPRPMEKGNDH